MVGPAIKELPRDRFDPIGRVVGVVIPSAQSPLAIFSLEASTNKAFFQQVVVWRIEIKISRHEGAERLDGNGTATYNHG